MGKIHIENGIISSSADYGLYRGTSKIANIQDGEFRVLGNLIAENYIVSSSVTSLTYQSLSGSTIFGDTADDTHQFTGSLSTSGSLSVTGNIHTHTFNTTSGGSNGVVSFIDATDNTYNLTRFYVQDANNNASRLTFDFRGHNGNNKILAGTSTGKVGIGTTSPDKDLHIHQANSNALHEAVTIRTNSSGEGLCLGINADNSGYVYSAADASKGLRLSGASSARATGHLFISSSGNIGIGTDSPVAPLHIGTTANAITGTSVDVSNLQFKILNPANDNDEAVGLGFALSTNSENIGAAIIHDRDGAESEGNLHFATKAAGEAGAADIPINMTLDSSGNLGIGTTTPMDSSDGITGLEIGGSATPGLTIKSTSSSQIYSLWADASGNINIQDNTNNITLFKLDANSRISLSNNDGGTLNTAVGYQAGNALTTNSTENTVYGHQAGLALSTGDYNTAIGALALKTEDAGNRAVAVGTSALFSQNVGSGIAGNVAVGFTAGYYNVTGTLNTWIGHEAGFGASGNSNSQNTGLGYRAGYSITSGSNNTLLGRQTGLELEGGTDNVFVGMNAGAGTVSGTEMVAIGTDAMSLGVVTTAATGTVAIGQDALKNLVSGAQNTAIGSYNSDALTTGGYNTSVGRSTLGALTAGSHNVALGRATLTTAADDESDNIAIGNSAMGSAKQDGTASSTNREVKRNIAIGTDALAGGTLTGARHLESNIAIGYQALDTTAANEQIGTIAIGTSALGALTDGNFNIAIGFESQLYQTDGTGNTTLGYQSFRNADNGESNNAVIGYEAGEFQNHASSDGNVWIGAEVCVGGTGNRDYSIAIGYRAWSNAGTQNNIGGSENIFIGAYSGNGTWATNASDQNTAVGYNTMAGAMNQARYNSAFGFESLNDLTTGDYNTAIGYKSADAVTTGGKNVAVGSFALSTTTLADEVVAIGYAASNASLLANGNGSVAIGFAALNNHQQNLNVAIGYHSGKTLSTGGNNTGVGYLTLGGNNSNALTGDNNTTIGHQAGRELEGAAESNVLVGKNSGLNITTGANNTIVGTNAGDALVDETHNVAVGTDALGGSSLVDQTVVIGSQAGMGAMEATADGTVLVGYGAGKSITSGGGNIVIGAEAAEDITTGQYNTIIGQQAMQNAQTGVSNVVAVGWRAGYKLGDDGGSDHSENNILIGVSAGGGGSSTAANNTANTNVAVGNYALGGNNGSTNFTSTNCVAIGHEALDSLQGGYSNTAIGHAAGDSITGGAFNVVIGTNAAVSTANAENQIVIGRSATGTGDNQTVIGNSSQTHVVFGGNALISGSAASTGSFGMVTAGVSTAQAGGKFHVKGSGLGNALGIIEDTVGNANFLLKATATNKNSILLFGDAASDEIGRIDYDHQDNSLDFVVNNGTAVSINSSQQSTFNGNINLPDDIALSLGSGTDAQIWNNGSNTNIRNNTADQDIIFMVNDGGATETEVMRIDGSTSRVGINESSPGAKLHITDGNGTLPTLIGTDYFVIQNNDNTGDQARMAIIAGATGYSVIDFGDASDVDAGGIAYQHHASNDRMWFRVNATDAYQMTQTTFSGSAETTGSFGSIHTAGNVGIGLASAGTILDIDSGAAGESSAESAGVRITGQRNGNITALTMRHEAASGGASGADNGIGMHFQGYDGSNSYHNMGAIYVRSAEDSVSDSDSPGYMTFHTTPNGSDTIAERVRIDKDGHVGIGEANPVYPLHITSEQDNNLAAQIQNTEATDGRNYGLRLRGGSTSADYSLSVEDHDGVNSLLRVRGDGNVGIGTDNPVQKLHIHGGSMYIQTNQSITWNNGDAQIGAVSGYHFRVQTYTGSSLTEKLRVTSEGNILFQAADAKISGSSSSTGSFGAGFFGGNVGIGTTTPAYPLQIQKPQSDNGAMLQVGEGGFGAVVAGSTAGHTHAFFGNFKYDFADPTTSTALYTNAGEGINMDGYGLHFFATPNATVDSSFTPTEIMSIISETGKVGIGTTSPAQIFHISGSGNLKSTIESAGSSAGVQIKSAGENFNSSLEFLSAGSSNGQIYYDHHATAGSQKMIFQVGDGAVNALQINGDGTTTFINTMTIDSGGTSRITIDGNNTSGDDGNLQIYGHTSAASRAYLTINNGVSSGGQYWYVGALRGNNSFAIGRDNDFGTDTDFYINSSGDALFAGKVGIDTTNPTSQLHVDGNVDVTGSFFLSRTSTYSNKWTFVDSNFNSDSYGSLFIFPTLSTANVYFRDHSGNHTLTLMNDQKVGIGNRTPVNELNVTGNITASSGIYAEELYARSKVVHEGDTDTYVEFGGDNINLVAGGVKMVTLKEGSSDSVIINEDSNDVNFRVESNSVTSMLKVDGGTDRVGIGQGTPTAVLHVETPDYDQPVFFTKTPTSDAGTDYIANEMEFGDTSVNQGACILHLNFSGDSSILATHDYIRFSDSAGEVGTISNELTYNPFTGGHISQRPSGSSYDDWKPGMIVKSTGNLIATGSNISTAWPEVELTTTQKDKAVMGVFSETGSAGHNDSHLDRTLPRLRYNAIGEGMIRVTDTGGNIETGDYICSSTRTGHGEKQDDDLMHNYTVAKATQPYNFTSASNDADLGYKSVLIACTYHCG